MKKLINGLPQTIAAYGSWIVSFLLWVYFMFTSRTAILGLLTAYYIGNNFQRRMTAQLIDRVYLLFTGIIWLILMVAVENYFRRGIENGDLARRIGRILAPEMFLIVLAECMLAFLIGFAILPASRWLLIVLEVTGLVFSIWLMRQTRWNTPKKKRTQSTW